MWKWYESRSAKISLDSRTPRSACAPSGSNRVLSPIAAASTSETRTLRPQGLAQCLDPRNLIDRGADDRKVKAIDSTYIAIEHLAKMKCEIDGGNRLAHLCSVSVKPVKAA